MVSDGKRRLRAAAAALFTAALLTAAASGVAGAQEPTPDPASIGTGFVVSADGAIITTAHGVDRCRSVTLTPSKGAPVEASDVKIERSLDLALIRAKLPGPLRPLPLRTDPAPILGEPVYLLGYPLQRPLLLGHPSFYATVVSGHGGMRGDPQVFRLPILALPGMSGAPVLDASGRVVGVVKTHLIETNRQSGLALGGQSFAILVSNLAKFGVQQPAARGTDNAEPMSSAEIAARALASTVLITCNKDERK